MDSRNGTTEKENTEATKVNSALTVSILIPTYRRPKDLERCLKSILTQQTPALAREVEILVCEDCSGADYELAYAEVEQKYSESVRFLKNKENLGMAVNLKRMAKLARAEFCLILTDDDSLLQDALQKCVEYAREAEENCRTFVHTPRPSVNEAQEYVTTAGWIPPFHVTRKRPFVALSICRKNYVLSGFLISTQSLRKSPWTTMEENAYFPIAVSFFAVQSGGMISKREPLVLHTVENQTHWHRWGDTDLSQSRRLFRDQIHIFALVYNHARESSQTRLEKVILRLIHFRNTFTFLVTVCSSDLSVDSRELKLRLNYANNKGPSTTFARPLVYMGRCGYLAGRILSAVRQRVSLSALQFNETVLR